jgi:hypothetical protein
MSDASGASRAAEADSAEASARRRRDARTSTAPAQIDTSSGMIQNQFTG